MAILPYIMAAALIYCFRVELLHEESEDVAVAEVKVWKVLKSKDFPEGVKYSLYLVLKQTGKVIMGYDNHKPKGHHFHKDGKEQSYDFRGEDALVEEFWNLVNKEGFQI